MNFPSMHVNEAAKLAHVELSLPALPRANPLAHLQPVRDFKNYIPSQGQRGIKRRRKPANDKSRQWNGSLPSSL